VLQYSASKPMSSGGYRDGVSVGIWFLEPLART
jgi:hypothetical protein